MIGLHVLQRLIGKIEVSRAVVFVMMGRADLRGRMNSVLQARLAERERSRLAKQARDYDEDCENLAH